MAQCCPYCKKELTVGIGYINRANKLGVPIYCNRVCAGLGRRHNKTVEQKKAEKAEYDREFRRKNAEKLKVQKAASHKLRYDPIKQREYNQKRMPKHVEYCRQPEYKKKKIEYDQQHTAKKNYGEFAECAILIEKIGKVLVERADKSELRTIQGTNNKSKRRKKQWLRLLQNLPQLT